MGEEGGGPRHPLKSASDLKISIEKRTMAGTERESKSSSLLGVGPGHRQFSARHWKLDIKRCFHSLALFCIMGKIGSKTKSDTGSKLSLESATTNWKECACVISHYSIIPYTRVL